MSQLSSMQRKFVEQLYENPSLTQGQAMLNAGYKPKVKRSKDPDALMKSAKQQAWRFLKNPLVLDAIKEVGVDRYRAKLPRVIGALDHVIHDPKHRDHVKVLHGLLDRVGMPAVQETKQTITHDVTAFEVITRIKALAAKLDLLDDDARINDARLNMIGRAVVSDGDIVEAKEPTE